jgi:hypothetical protein
VGPRWAAFCQHYRKGAGEAVWGREAAEELLTACLLEANGAATLVPASSAAIRTPECPDEDVAAGAPAGRGDRQPAETEGRPAARAGGTALRDQLTLRARVAAFLTDRAQTLQRIPTWKEVVKAFPDDNLGSRATFYRKNPWYADVRAACKQILGHDAPQKGHRDAGEDGGLGDVDGLVDAPDYYRDDAD